MVVGIPHTKARVVFAWDLQLKMQAYAELMCQSNFSFLTGASHPEELVKQADFLGYKAIAITDECSVAGVARAYSTIRANRLNIKLIIGSLFVIPEQHLRVVVLCPNHQGYAEMCRIITNARRRSEKGSYALDFWDLRTLKHSLIMWLPSGDQQTDEAWAEQLPTLFPHRLWIGCRRHLVANENDYIEHCAGLSARYDIPITACGSVLMHVPERLALQHTLTAIRLGKPVSQLGRHLLSNSEPSLRTINKLNHLFHASWLDEAVAIAERCTFCLSELRYQYPAELIPSEHTPTSYLRALVEQGIQKRFPDGLSNRPDILAIIEKELALIASKQYEYFFITVFDVVQFAKKHDILYQGRGSAANSVVCYCLEITAVDPRQVDVLFERFISKERDEEPDIDVDFEHERREEVIQYIYQKYGRHRTALAATVTTFRTKSALREVGKALGIDDTQIDYFVKNINHRDASLGWQSQIERLGFHSQSRQSQQFVELVESIKGFPRHLSQHVGGFVISSGPLYELVAVENTSMPDRTVIQWDKDDLESLGLLKIDVLALGMLTAIRKSFDLVKQHYGHNWSIPRITRLKDDRQVYGMIQKADTVGVFQIESRAQMSMLPRLKPATYYDLVIQIAIVRPGPIQGGMVHPFLKNRDKPHAISYPSKALETVLKRTNGVPIFQEQVIKIAMVAAGFSGGEADQLRRAMGTWKTSGALEKYGEKLKKGMLKNGYSEAYAKRIFEQIKGFGVYGFPESHSASFAVLAYVSSWLKYYYPAAFYVGLLNSWPMGFYPPSQLVADAKRHKVAILPICINQSDYDHKLEYYQQNWAIRLGFRLIKGLSKKVGIDLYQQRPEYGFASINQIKQLAIPQDELEALASADVFKQLEGHRYQTRWSLMNTEPNLSLFSSLDNNDMTNNQRNYKPAPATQVEELVEDYHATSLSIAHHPIALLRQAGLLEAYTPANRLIQIKHKSLVTVVGVVVGRQRPGTSKGVTFMTLEDDTGNVNVIVWLATARYQQKQFLKSNIVQVKGILERGDGGVTHIIAGKIEDKSHLIKTLDIRARDFH
jgi:error-prone DNA polymerase